MPKSMRVFLKERREGIRFETDVDPGERAELHYRPVTSGSVLNFIAWLDCEEYFDLIALRVEDTPTVIHWGSKLFSLPLTERVSFEVGQTIFASIRNTSDVTRRFCGSMVIVRAPSVELPAYHTLLNTLCDRFHVPGAHDFAGALDWIDEHYTRDEE